MKIAYSKSPSTTCANILRRKISFSQSAASGNPERPAVLKISQTFVTRPFFSCPNNGNDVVINKILLNGKIKKQSYRNNRR